MRKESDKKPTEDLNHDGEEVHLSLPGGEITVHPKKMGLIESAKILALYGLMSFLADAVFPSDRQYLTETEKLRLALCYDPPIPNELWHVPTSATREIQRMRQRNMMPWRSGIV